MIMGRRPLSMYAPWYRMTMFCAGGIYHGMILRSAKKMFQPGTWGCRLRCPPQSVAVGFLKGVGRSDSTYIAFQHDILVDAVEQSLIEFDALFGKKRTIPVKLKEAFACDIHK